MVNIHIYVIQYTKCEPLKITNVNELRKLVKQFNFKGNGTQQNPYVIENLYVIVGALHDAMVFENITDYCVITHCIIEYEKNPCERSLMDGIYLKQCANFVIEHNVIKYTFRGINVQECRNIIIKNNHYIGTDDAKCGILVNGSNNFVIGNVCMNANYGISISTRTYAFVCLNHCIDNIKCGMYATGGNYIVMSYNVVIRCQHLSLSTSNTKTAMVSNNVFAYNTTEEKTVVQYGIAVMHKTILWYNVFYLHAKYNPYMLTKTFTSDRLIIINNIICGPNTILVGEFD